MFAWVWQEICVCVCEQKCEWMISCFVCVIWACPAAIEHYDQQTIVLDYITLLSPTVLLTCAFDARANCVYVRENEEEQPRVPILILCNHEISCVLHATCTHCTAKTEQSMHLVLLLPFLAISARQPETTALPPSFSVCVCVCVCMCVCVCVYLYLFSYPDGDLHLNAH